MFNGPVIFPIEPEGPSRSQLPLTRAYLDNLADSFRIRASACGTIMTNARGGSGMGDTAKTYCENWVKEQLYLRRKEFSSKYTDKGNEVEASSIDYASEYLGWGLVAKNEQHFTDHNMTGTPDIILADRVVDIKNSWDCFTFPLFDTEIPEKKYYWQGQVYMALTGRLTFDLVYTLMNAPDHLIEQEARRSADWQEVEAELYDAVRERMSYDKFDQTLRIKRFEVAKNEKDIALIILRVEECRAYIRTITDKIKTTQVTSV